MYTEHLNDKMHVIICVIISKTMYLRALHIIQSVYIHTLATEYV